MSLSIEQSLVEDGMILLKLKGAVDQDTFDVLEEELTRNTEGGVVKIVVDLTEVYYFSSSGLGVLVGAMSQLKMEPGGALVLFGMTDGVRSVFDTMGFTSMFDLPDDKQSAIELARNA